MASYMDVSVRDYLASYNKRFTKGRKLKRLNFSIYLFQNKQIPFSLSALGPRRTDNITENTNPIFAAGRGRPLLNIHQN